MKKLFEMILKGFGMAANLEHVELENKCPHKYQEHNMCFDCGKDLDPSDEIDRAYDEWRDGTYEN